MPPIFLMDDYDRCLVEGSAKVKAVYCYTRTQIKPNDTSPLWKIIEVNFNIFNLNIVFASFVWLMCMPRFVSASSVAFLNYRQLYISTKIISFHQKLNLEIESS